MMKITIIGCGLSGSEAAYQLLKRGQTVEMIEMRPHTMTPAHTTNFFSELVCSNSLRSDDDLTSAVGLLHYEMRKCDSLIMQAADATRVPAGSALAVNRHSFAEFVTEKLKSFENFHLTISESDIPLNPAESVVLATGPLSSDKITNRLAEITGSESLHFFDAIAPIVHTDSIDMNHAWWQSRYDKGDGLDYLNCALTKDEYNTFITALSTAPRVPFKEWEQKTPYFEGCLPVEVMAERGSQALRYGPMKPVGLFNPHEERRPFAVVQLRKENREGTLMNMVGFQTKMTYGAQREVWKLIPALRNAEFARLGGIHRNTFVCGPRVLTPTLSLKKHPYIKMAGQITGCEGYVESAAIGLLAGLFCHDSNMPPPPRETAMGAMLAHITAEANAETFQPMNINFGLFPEINATDESGRRIKGVARRQLYTDRAKTALDAWQKSLSRLF